MTEQTETRDLIAALKHYLVHRADAQRKAKRARRTIRTPGAERAALLAELGLEDDLAAIQAWVAHGRYWLTVAHVLYGDLRDRPHPVPDANRYRAAAETFVANVLRGPAG